MFWSRNRTDRVERLLSLLVDYCKFTAHSHIEEYKDVVRRLGEIDKKLDELKRSNEIDKNA
jgi:hypothetical protein